MTSYLLRYFKLYLAPTTTTITIYISANVTRDSLGVLVS